MVIIEECQIKSENATFPATLVAVVGFWRWGWSAMAPMEHDLALISGQNQAAAGESIGAFYLWVSKVQIVHRNIHLDRYFFQHRQIERKIITPPEDRWVLLARIGLTNASPTVINSYKPVYHCLRRLYSGDCLGSPCFQGKDAAPLHLQCSRD